MERDGEGEKERLGSFRGARVRGSSRRTGDCSQRLEYGDSGFITEAVWVVTRSKVTLTVGCGWVGATLSPNWLP